MKKLFVLAVAALALSGCSTYSRTDRTLGGAAIGAASGAVIGNAVGGTGSTIAGALIGGAAGAIIGSETTPKACWARDSHGNRYRVACP